MILSTARLNKSKLEFRLTQYTDDCVTITHLSGHGEQGPVQHELFGFSQLQQYFRQSMHFRAVRCQRLGDWMCVLHICVVCPTGVMWLERTGSEFDAFGMNYIMQPYVHLSFSPVLQQPLSFFLIDAFILKGEIASLKM